MIHYDHPFKVFHATVPHFGWTESYLQGFNLLRSLLLTWDYFFSTMPTNDTNNQPDEGRIRYQLRRTDVEYQVEDHSIAQIDIEAFHPYPPYATTLSAKLAEMHKIWRACRAVRACWPHRRMGYYAVTPHYDWYAITNWLSVAANKNDPNYANYLAVYRDWQANSRLNRFGGFTNRRHLNSWLTYMDFTAPAPYLPKNTTYIGGPSWKTHPDCLRWSQYYRHQTREAKQVPKACLPWVQFHLPETSTFLGTDWVVHTLNTALADHYETGHTDGIVIYLPTGGQSADYIATVAQWIDDNLLP